MCVCGGERVHKEESKNGRDQYRIFSNKETENVGGDDRRQVEISLPVFCCSQM